MKSNNNSKVKENNNMNDEQLANELSSRIESLLSKEEMTLEWYVACSQAIAQLIIAREMLIKRITKL